ncbi:MAG: hypothetical protein DCC46_06735 [Armatimonadetes bacterium]|nr:MAG: hypothetical protein DCC46_06735 [Armatimonadota bacterium]
MSKPRPNSTTESLSNIAAVALTTASAFLLLVAVALNSPALFYMSTAMIATIGASRLQAWLSVRGLRFERTVPPVVRARDLVTIELTAWSLRKIRRPLIMVSDFLPERMVWQDLSPSLPIAPAFGQAISTQYQFKPVRRGRYVWSRLAVFGSDALGLVTMSRKYETEPSEMLVLPDPLPLDLDFSSAAGWGFSEAEHGRSRGHGIEPRGVRQYFPGDALRHVHWRTTARTGQLMVKEFETGSQSGVSLYLQTERGSDIGEGVDTTLERVCSHLAYSIKQFLRQGVAVQLPGRELDPETQPPQEREQNLMRLLAEIEAIDETPLSSRILSTIPELAPNNIVYVFVAVEDAGLPGAIGQLRRAGHDVTAVLYDAERFAPPKRKSSLSSATNPNFVDDLRDAGATILLAPLGGAP